MTDMPSPAESIVAAPRLWRRWLASGELQFWTIQWVGWAAWAFASGIGWIYSMDKPDRAHVVLLYIWAASVGVAVTTVLRYVYRALWTRTLKVRITVAVILSYA